jgi:hypothetical protein
MVFANTENIARHLFQTALSVRHSLVIMASSAAQNQLRAVLSRGNALKGIREHPISATLYEQPSSRLSQGLIRGNFDANAKTRRHCHSHGH